MTNMEKEYYMSKPTIAYWSAWSGVEVKAIEYGIDDYLICVVGTFIDKPTLHKVKVRYDHDRDYIVIGSHRFYLDECLRTGL